MDANTNPEVNVTTEENLDPNPSFDQAAQDAEKAAQEQAEKEAKEAEAIATEKAAQEQAEKEAKASKAASKKVKANDITPIKESDEKIKVKININLAFGSKKYKEGDEAEFTEKELDCLLGAWYEIL
ncbi:MAG TPA: hypothetical protein PKC87_00770 [Candidatus Absconditabacterales bacterium]|nr:hypothetical protein [Candidatus Absconditabacterales bacterium]